LAVKKGLLGVEPRGQPGRCNLQGHIADFLGVFAAVQSVIIGDKITGFAGFGKLESRFYGTEIITDMRDAVGLMPVSDILLVIYPSS
jgi:hypothetical protein